MNISTAFPMGSNHLRNKKAWLFLWLIINQSQSLDWNIFGIKQKWELSLLYNNQEESSPQLNILVIKVWWVDMVPNCNHSIPHKRKVSFIPYVNHLLFIRYPFVEVTLDFLNLAPSHISHHSLNQHRSIHSVAISPQATAYAALRSRNDASSQPKERIRAIT